MPKFSIEQIALYPTSPLAAKELLAAMGMDDWAEDHVVAEGHVAVARDSCVNHADLSFNYQSRAGRTDPLELEVLHYTAGPNWMMKAKEPCVSHIGMHCTEEELAEWRAFFCERGIPVAQEVRTLSHTNPHIAGKRRYHYVIFDTRAILGVDVKFIVRHDA